MRNALREVGLRSIEKVSKPTLSAKHVKERLEFAKMHKGWTIHDWERVVFSDETKINCLCSDGISWYWIRYKKEFSARAVKQTVKHGGGSLKLWSCLTAKGVGSLYKIEQTLNVVRYLGLLQEELYITLILILILVKSFFTKTMYLSIRLKLCRNGFGSNHTLLWTSLLNHQTSVPLNMCGLS